MTSSNRVYIFGVTPEGEWEFMETTLDSQGAKKSCSKYLKMFPQRFDKMVHGTAIDYHDHTMTSFHKESDDEDQ